VIRRISLLIEGATETECGECDYASSAIRWDDAGAPICTRPEFAVNGEAPIREDERRVAACLAAEAEHAAMERDARLGAKVRASIGELAKRDLVILDNAVAEYREKRMVFAEAVVGATAAALREEARDGK
jgi:hypothetical protein